MENVTVEVLTVRLTTRVSSPTGPPLADNLFWRDSINQVRQHGGAAQLTPPLSGPLSTHNPARCIAWTDPPRAREGNWRHGHH